MYRDKQEEELQIDIYIFIEKSTTGSDTKKFYVKSLSNFYLLLMICDVGTV